MGTGGDLIKFVRGVGVGITWWAFYPQRRNNTASRLMLQKQLWFTIPIIGRLDSWSAFLIVSLSLFCSKLVVLIFNLNYQIRLSLCFLGIWNIQDEFLYREPSHYLVVLAKVSDMHMRVCSSGVTRYISSWFSSREGAFSSFPNWRWNEASGIRRQWDGIVRDSGSQPRFLGGAGRVVGAGVGILDWLEERHNKTSPNYR